MRRLTVVLVVAVLVAGACSAAGDVEVTAPVATATVEPTAEPTVTPEPAPEPTVAPEPTQEPPPTPEPQPTPAPEPEDPPVDNYVSPLAALPLPDWDADPGVAAALPASAISPRELFSFNLPSEPEISGADEFPTRESASDWLYRSAADEYVVTVGGNELSLDLNPEQLPDVVIALEEILELIRGNDFAAEPVAYDSTQTLLGEPARVAQFNLGERNGWILVARFGGNIIDIVVTADGPALATFEAVIDSFSPNLPPLQDGADFFAAANDACYNSFEDDLGLIEVAEDLDYLNVMIDKRIEARNALAEIPVSAEDRVAALTLLDVYQREIILYVADRDEAEATGQVPPPPLTNYDAYLDYRDIYAALGAPNCP